MGKAAFLAGEFYCMGGEWYPSESGAVTPSVRLRWHDQEILLKCTTSDIFFIAVHLS